MSIATRQRVCNLLSFSDGTQQADLLSPARTQTDLIALLQRAAFPCSEGGLGYRLLITSVRTDHGDDSALGPHGHSFGYAVDLWPADEATLKQFLIDMAERNSWVTKIGLGGLAAQYLSNIPQDSVVVFQDNSTDHVHLQSQ
ncbi:MAG TPA: hypothetical protein VIG51_03920 [Candidatus Baltobacteraceae bacterium]|jgi:hypothetical protein|nr:hypothetical protein [Candidatus Baltobacteraceae bacterium]